MAVILSAKEPSQIMKQSIKDYVSSMNKKPSLGIILVGNNPASLSYVKGKSKDCQECGIICKIFHFSEYATEQEILDKIQEISNELSGIFVQLPLPSHLNKDNIIQAIPIEKDVDCFTLENLGKLFIGKATFLPCTPCGILKLLKYYNIDVAGKHCVIIGRSDIVGKPLALLLTQHNATTTLCHSKTQNLKQYTLKADIVICAIGSPKFLTADMVSENSIIIDVGINRDEDGKLCGDTDFENLQNKCSAITPVPGGVGLMTRVALLENMTKTVC